MLLASTVHWLYGWVDGEREHKTREGGAGWSFEDLNRYSYHLGLGMLRTSTACSLPIVSSTAPENCMHFGGSTWIRLHRNSPSLSVVLLPPLALSRLGSNERRCVLIGVCESLQSFVEPQSLYICNDGFCFTGLWFGGFLSSLCLKKLKPGTGGFFTHFKVRYLLNDTHSEALLLNQHETKLY